MTRPGPLAALLLVAACGGGVPSGLSEDLASKVRFCRKMPGDVMDWCVFESLQGAVGVPTQSFYALCRDMGDQGAHDACLELFSRSASSTGFEVVCDQIHQERMRESCYLTAAEGVMRGSASIQEIVASCRKAGSLEAHCLSHFPAQRTAFWMQSGGPSAVAAEIYALQQLEPGVASMEGVGFAMGVAIQAMGAPNGPALCAAFAPGSASRSCYKVLNGGASSGAGALPPVGSPFTVPAP